MNFEPVREAVTNPVNFFVAATFVGGIFLAACARAVRYRLVIEKSVAMLNDQLITTAEAPLPLIENAEQSQARCPACDQMVSTYTNPKDPAKVVWLGGHPGKDVVDSECSASNMPIPASVDHWLDLVTRSK